MARKRKRQKPRRPKRTKVPVAKRGLIDLVMPIYGEWALAEDALEHLYADIEYCGLEEQARVIVFDNGSPPFSMEDGTVVTPEQQSLGVKKMLREGKDIFLRTDENAGYPMACNTAVGQGRSPLICIVSADTNLQPGALNEIVKEFDNPEVGVVGIKLLFPENDSPHGNPGTVQHAGHAFNVAGQIHHIFIGWSSDHPKVNIRREMNSVTGAVFATRRNIFEPSGGFDPVYGKGTYEDVDYCFKVRAGGKKVVYTPRAVAYHKVGGSIVDGANKESFNLTINEQIFKGRWLRFMAWDEWRYY